MLAVVVATIAIGCVHMAVGLLSLCVGVAASTQAQIWMAHSVSPIWSGGFFIITGILGIVCAKRMTAYMIMCFTAFSIVSLVICIVSIQLLRFGLVNHTTDGQTFQKKHKDILILVALGTAGFEILVCLVSAFVSCRLAKAAKKELQKKREGTFHVQEDEEREQGLQAIEDYYAKERIELENMGIDFRTAYLDFQKETMEEAKQAEMELNSAIEGVQNNAMEPNSADDDPDDISDVQPDPLPKTENQAEIHVHSNDGIILKPDTDTGREIKPKKKKKKGKLQAQPSFDDIQVFNDITS